jgi:hypothetical protein
MPKSRPKTTSRATARTTTNRSLLKRPGATPHKRSGRPDTKHARVIAMLQSAAGATIARMMATTNWQQHSVRGFLAGVIRKKLKLNLVSELTDKGRVYRIKDDQAGSVGASRAKQAT